MKKFFSYDKSIYILWLVSFIAGFDLMSAFLIPFFRDWGGLSQFQVQMVQSWFAFWMVIFEIPTGLIGDVRGRKFSVLAGFIFSTVGLFLYGSLANFWIFLLSEFLLAIGLAFCSGAQEALLYDTVKEKGQESHFPKINIIDSNMSLLGMFFGSLASSFLIRLVNVNKLIQLSAIPFVICFALLYFFIHEPKVELKEDFVPDYKKTFKSAFRALKSNKALKRLVVFVVAMSSLTYFAVWFYQVGLREIAIDESLYGFFRMLLLGSEVVLSYVIVRLLKGTIKKLTIIFFSISLVALGFLVPGVNLGLFSLVALIVFSGGIGTKIRTIFSPFLNAQIESQNRATVLSFISLARRFSLIILNLVFGYLADVNFKLTLLILGALVLGIAIIWGPEEGDLANSPSTSLRAS